jgi:hypothetical protein
MNDEINETLRRIEEQLNEPMIQRLTLHAAMKLERRWWQGVLGGEPPGGLKPMDFVQRAVEKTVQAAEGDKSGRHWNFETQPDLSRHLRSVIDSDISHLVEGWENRTFRSEEFLNGTNSDEDSEPALSLLLAQTANPSELCAANEIEQAREKILFEFFDSLADDPQLQRLMELIFDGVGKSGEQAKKLGLTANEMYVVTRRMQRHIEQFKEKRAKSLAEARSHA